ncbi:hypothetical protein A6F68_02182 [Tsuneonella dongtanensis]|uniref:Squalene/phytoene synthase n=1 Tax=Tsuneonella dongtanensis TaxID=692370 RepID=A0A1B2AEW5_9SPHN|nr:hypothetical protein [Tsuneonella dongtanensis]ANY20683.1 hypothetical protein A6F68_02182 [Tsuneonella dongtanensis]
MVNKFPNSASAISHLPPEQRLGIAYTPEAQRPALAALLAFDAMLGRFIARDTEPVLVQLRLAWWREQLGGSARSATSNDPLLSEIKAHWDGAQGTLVQLVDGWEGLLGEATDMAIANLVAARGATFAAFAELAGAESESESARTAGELWALADLRARTDDARRRSVIDGMKPPLGTLPRRRELRGLCVLGGLGRRALAKDQRLLHDRRAVLFAFRLGLMGG